MDHDERARRPRSHYQIRTDRPAAPRRYPPAPQQPRLPLHGRVGSRHAVRRDMEPLADTTFRPDVEGLRAIAVVSVLIYHAWPKVLTGGFVGVDVFFVLSGFLITRLLVKELASSGTISLPTFWARRFRRLLPASSLMIVATLLASLWMLAPLSRKNLAMDTVGAATYSANFGFAARYGDYLAEQAARSDPSPLLHMWSLAVEEQFYLIWPLLLLGLTRWAYRYRRLLVTVAAAMFVAGIGVSVWWTNTNATWAYYMLPARMSELLAGALLALSPALLASIPRALRAPLGWAGIAAILYAVFRFTEQTEFPGIAAMIPVLGTCAVIASAARRGDGWEPTPLLGHPVMQWIGKHSYGIYLWHWPVLVLARAKWGQEISSIALVACLAVSIALAAVSLKLVEDPTRHSRWLAARDYRSLSLISVFCLALTACAWKLHDSVGSLAGGEAVAAPTLGDPGASPGPLTTDTGVTTPVDPNPVDPEGSTPPVSTPGSGSAVTGASTPATGSAVNAKVAALVAEAQKFLTAATKPQPVPENLDPALSKSSNFPRIYQDKCVNQAGNARLKVCEYGVKDSQKLMVIFGDSHAAHWFEPMDAIAQAHGYRLVAMFKGGCPWASIQLAGGNTKKTCPPWKRDALAWLKQNKPDVLVVAQAYLEYGDDVNPDAWAKGVSDALPTLKGLTNHLFVLGDVPNFLYGVTPASCLSKNLNDITQCQMSRDKATRPSRQKGERDGAAAVGVPWLDPTDWLCTPTICPAVVGNVLLDRDPNHLTAAGAMWLKPILEAALAPALS